MSYNPQKRSFWAVLSALGEFFAFWGASVPCWANFVAFWGNGGHRNETGGTFASECGRLNETDIASASEKRARNGRKWCAEVMWVSVAAEITRAKVLSVSSWWKYLPVGCRCIHLSWLRCPWAVMGANLPKSRT